MERKTKIDAEPGQPGLTITREFDLPLDLLFRAHSEKDIIEEWMSTKVIKLENKQHGSWRYETSNPEGIIVFSAHGTIHEFEPGKKITRTFEMDNAPFGVQLEFIEFEKLTDDTSKLSIHSIYRSAALRDQMLKLPFSYGLNMAHNRLQEIVSKRK